MLTTDPSGDRASGLADGGVEMLAVGAGLDLGEPAAPQVDPGGRAVQVGAQPSREARVGRARQTTTVAAVPASPRPEQPYASGSAIVVEHDAARLDYDGRAYRLTMRRLLRNTGTAPITRYLIRISVDRYPGDPERSNAHYRQYPLTWDELALTATCRGETMCWEAKHDRDAFKEV